ncbi:MAG: hypothetical protein M3N25_06315 [Actinomycetota bacterium]|nr:hypothetical protein [Actinomycetota bacterium]
MTTPAQHSRRDGSVDDLDPATAGASMGPVAHPAHVRRRRALVAVWVGVAVVAGVLLVLSRAVRGPLDDPDPARQRPGLLDVGGLPTPAPPVTDDVPRPGRRAVVFFVRPPELEPLCEALTGAELRAQADVAVVLMGDGGQCVQGLPVVPDPDAELAARFGLPAPRDGGPPVGYAVVDGAGDIRYRTLDPQVASLLGEVSTMVEAVS